MYSTAEGQTGLLHQARTTITGTQSRSTLAKHLASRTPGLEIDWPGLVELASTKTLSAYRTGEPAILLRDAPQPSATGHLLPPVLLDRLPTVWYGFGASGKSYLALAAALSIHTDRPLIGIEPAARRRVAILDWELDAWTHRERMHSLTGGEMPDLIYVRCSASIWDELDRLQKIIQERSIGYVVVDSVGMACGGVPIETSEAPLRFNEALRGLNVGALCVAHRTKGEGGENDPFGSVFWTNSARSIFYVKREEGPDPAHFTVALHHKKANTGPKLTLPLAFDFAFTDDQLAIKRVDARENDDIRAALPLRTRIQYALRGGPRLIADLAEETEASEDAIRMAITRGRGKYLTILGDGNGRRVALLHHGEEPS